MVVIIGCCFQYLSQCDRVLLMKDGCVLESGTHSELIKQDGEFANLMKTYYTNRTNENGKKILLQLHVNEF